MLTVREFDMPKLLTEKIKHDLSESEDILNIYEKHIGFHPNVKDSRFANCVEIFFENYQSKKIAIKVFTDSTCHITGVKKPHIGIELAWMMHHIICAMHTNIRRRTHVDVKFDNIHADFSMMLPRNCVMNTIRMREVINNGILDQFENADFEFIQVKPDYRIVSRNKHEYTGTRINIMFRMYDDVYQVCVTPFNTGSCLICSKNPEAINKICILMIKFFSLV